MTGILSRDLFGNDTLAIGCAANVGVRFLGLDVIATGTQRDSVSEETRRNMKH